MFYISDHGESLGENGVYLHGLPYAIAPVTQKYIPAIIWLSDNFTNYLLNSIKKKESLPL